MTRRRWGYVVWGVALAFVFVPELLAASPLTESQLPFPTISRTIGHLEFEHARWEIATTFVIVFAIYSLLRAPRRTPGGRVTVATVEPRDEIERIFPWATLASAAAITAATLVANAVWPAKHLNYRVAYVLYGSIGLLWIVGPSVYSFVAGKDAEFPTLFRTVQNLEDALAAPGAGPFRRALAWLLPLLLVWALVFLALHIVLYPFPRITRILNPNG
jgi:hypothetical protein